MKGGWNGWVELCCDINWEDYYGMWGRITPDGSWYVLQWQNLLDAGGKEFEDTPYECQVKRLHLGETPKEEIKRALESCGLKLTERATLETNSGDEIELQYVERVIVESCISYGLGAPLESFTGRVKPRNIRANARRYAEQCMRDEALLEERLNRPVNGIGSTAREYGIGDVQSAMHRGPFDVSKNLMRKLSGMPFRTLKQSDLLKCKFAILVPEHYREDGSCRCSDAEHRKMMIQDWEYSEEDFADIPVRAS